jgi:hypothetical protein
MKVILQQTPNPIPCESTLRQSFWRWLSSLPASFCGAALRHPSVQRIVLASRAAAIFLSASLNNRRLYVGLWLLLVAAPLCSVAENLFDRNVACVDGWYYCNTFYFVFAISRHASLLLTLTGVFFLFSDKSLRKFFLIVPSTYHAAKLCWLILWVESNEQFHRILPLSFVLLGLLAAMAWYFAFDALLSLHFHKREGTIARIIGIMNAPGISAEVKERMAKDQIKQLERAEA